MSKLIRVEKLKIQMEDREELPPCIYFLTPLSTCFSNLDFLFSKYTMLSLLHRRIIINQNVF
jgi:hypothetical protein